MNYTWVALALVSTVLLAAGDALTRRSLAGDDEYLVAGFRLIFYPPALSLRNTGGFSSRAAALSYEVK